MAPVYKLTYFDYRAVAEPIRFLFKYGGIDFEDHRVDGTKWAEIKNNYPFGQLPLLEHNGKNVCQSVAICRYLGKEVKLAGKSNWEDAEIDAIVDAIGDLKQKITVLFFEKDEKVKEEKTNTVLKETLPFYLTRFDAIVKENKGHLALGRLTWADLYFVAILELLEFPFKENLVQNYPNLVQLQKTILAIPAIKKWIDTRPKTPY